MLVPLATVSTWEVCKVANIARTWNMTVYLLKRHGSASPHETHDTTAPQETHDDDSTSSQEL